MGMFDSYAVELTCPLDGETLRDWQGKDGPCALLHWTIGKARPDEALEGDRIAAIPEDEYLAAFSDEDEGGWPAGFAMSPRSRAAMRRGHVLAARHETLPPVFELHATCGDHTVEAVGETDHDGVWRSARVVLVDAWVRLPGFDEYPGILPDEPIRVARGERITLYRVDRLDEAAVARFEAYRAERRSELPANGGDAVCESAGYLHEPRAAAAWSGRFYCAECLERETPDGRTAGALV